MRKYRPARRGQFVALSIPLGLDVQDVVLNGTFEKTGGPDGGGYGLILRDQGPGVAGSTQSGRFLLFEAGDRGEVAVWQRDGARWIEIMPWTRSDAVRPGRAVKNELRVAAAGQQVSFYVNGLQVAGMSYTALPTQGGPGVFVGGDLNEVTIARLSIQVP